MKSEKRIFVAFLLNLLFSVFEIVGGLFTNSVSIISDAIHDMGDALSIGVSYLLERKSTKKPDDKFTYGYVRYSVFGGFITTAILIVGSVAVCCGAVVRLFNPVEVRTDGMIVFAVVGVVVNFIAAYFTSKGESINQKAVNLHMLEDVLGWLVVLIGSVVIHLTGFWFVDPLMSIGVAVFIFVNAIKNMKSVLDLFLEKTPRGIDIGVIREHLMEIDGVADVHHIHIWSLEGFNNCATMHIVSDNACKELKDRIKSELCEWKICHCTLEFETTEEYCQDAKCNANEVEIIVEHDHHHHH